MDSFALNPRQAVDQPSTPQPRQLSGGTVGGVSANPDLNINPNAVANATRGDTLTALLKIGGAILAPALKREQEARFVEGMSRAAQGEAAKDIAATKPDWVNLFGEGPVVQGARAYETMKDVADLETSITETMAEDVKLSPDAYAAALQKRVGDMATGDPQRDAAVKGMFLKVMPQAMRRHATGNAKWVQEEAFRKRGEAIGSVFKATESGLQSLRKAGALSPETLQAAADNLLASLAPAEGENVEHRDKQLVAHVAKELTAGNFEVVNLLQSVGAWDAMPTDKADQLNTLLRTKANQFVGEKDDGLKTLGAVNAVFDNLQNLTEKQLDAQLDAINAAHRERSGVPADYIDIRQRAAMHRQMDGVQRAASKVALTAAEKTMRLEKSQGVIKAALLAPTADGYRYGGLEIAKQVVGSEMTSDQIGQAVNQAWLTADLSGAPLEIRTRVLTSAEGKVPTFDQEVMRVAQQGQHSAGWDAIYAQHAYMKASKVPKESSAYSAFLPVAGLIKAYEYEQARAGEKDTPKDLYERARIRTLNDELAQDTKSLGKEDKAAVDTMVENWTDPWWLQFKGKVDDASQEVVKTAALAVAGRAGSGSPDERATWGMQGVWRVAERVGTLAVFSMAPGQDSMAKMLNAPEDMAEAAVRAALRKRIEADPRLTQRFGAIRTDDLKMTMRPWTRLPNADGKFKLRTEATIVVEGEPITLNLLVHQDHAQEELAAMFAAKRNEPVVQERINKRLATQTYTAIQR